jgi:hypothetical protein
MNHKNLKPLIGMIILTLIVVGIVLAVVFSGTDTSKVETVTIPAPVETNLQPADGLVTPLTTSP